MFHALHGKCEGYVLLRLLSRCCGPLAETGEQIILNVYIGFDRKETIAFHVLSHSILTRSSVPVAIIPLCRDNLRAAYTRPRGEKDSTDFSNSRWIVPYLQDYKGWAIFMDCDMLLRGEIAQLWALRDDRYSVMVRQHVHVPEETTKFLGLEQTRYRRKNWSSLMLMNCDRLGMLTRHLVNAGMHGLWFHEFQFLADDEIGDLPIGWNHLVDYDDYNPDAQLVHYTSLGPWHAPGKAREIEYGVEWLRMLQDMLLGANPMAHNLTPVEFLQSFK